MQRDLYSKGKNLPNFYEVSNLSQILKFKELFYSFEDLADRDNRGHRMYFRSWQWYTDFLETLEDIQNDVINDLSEIENDKTKNLTTKKILTDARVGQGKYKRELIDLWESCSLSGYSKKSLLIGSHIKPWSKCENDFEKLDKYNGFLLTPNLDKLFDKGLISFENNGKIIISNRLTKDDEKYFNLNIYSEINLFKENIKYLEFHREFHKEKF